MRKILIALILLPAFSFGQQLPRPEIQYYRHIIKQALKENIKYTDQFNKAIPNKATAIKIAEPILFKGYGKDVIIAEKPYNVDLVDGYWIVTGTLKQVKGQDVVGGVFLIILSEKDGRIIKIAHGK